MSRRERGKVKQPPLDAQTPRLPPTLSRGEWLHRPPPPAAASPLKRFLSSNLRLGWPWGDLHCILVSMFSIFPPLPGKTSF